MAEEPFKWRTIMIAASRDEWQLEDARERFEEAMQKVIESFDLRGVEININRMPGRSVTKDSDGVLVQLYAKVTWPLKQHGRVGLMELEDVMDDFNIGEQRLPPI